MMSRTTLCYGTAVLLGVLAIGIMAARQHFLGAEVNLPGGPGTWKITLLVQGKASEGARIWTATPLTSGSQRLLREHGRSDEFQAKPVEQHRDGRELSWTLTPGVTPGPFRIRYESFCSLRTNASTHSRDAVPKPGDYLQNEPGVECDHPAIADLARRLGGDLDRPQDAVEVFFRHVDEQVASDPSIAGAGAGAVQCLHQESGDSGAKSRLLTALCRNRGIPARLINGLILSRDDEQPVHTWVEIWLRGQWLPACTIHHHFGHVPKTYFALSHGNTPLVRAKNVRGLESAFLVERVLAATPDASPPSFGKRVFRAISLNALPMADQQLVEFLLLLPLAAIIICVFRNVVGLQTYGTFTPALIGLAFRDLRSWPGIIVFVGILLVGWLIRRAVSRFHLLQVPRTSAMLTLVVSVIIGFVILSNRMHWLTTTYISLFPLVILTSMIERFWTLEEEDGTRASFRTLFSTMVIALCISVAAGRQAVIQHMLRYPETIGLSLALFLVLGRYTGYRLTELYRFRDFVREPLPRRLPAEVHTSRRSFGPNRF